MNPLFFGPSALPRFGLYHPPLGRARGAFALVPAVGHEYLPAWPAVRQLGLLLAAAGHHVLRFDLTGQGDSAGTLADASVEVWSEDVELALTELSDLGGVPRPGLIGLRLGASLAALAAARRGGVERLVLWEPIVDGPALLAELEATRAAYLAKVLPRPRRAIAAGPRLDVMGFVVDEPLARSLSALDLRKLTRRPAAEVTLLLGAESAATSAFAARLRELGAKVDEWVRPGPPIWAKRPGLDEARVPTELLRELVERLGGGRS